MLKYRLSEDTDEHFEGIEGRELTLFIIHNDVSYECVINNDYDINNCILVIDQFIIKPHDDYPDVIIISYGSTTLRLLPVNLSYKRIHDEIQILKQRIYQLENAECKVPIQIPTYAPAFHTLDAEIVYEHWDNLDDLLSVYELHKYNKLLIVQIYNYILPLMKIIPTFDPDDELSQFIGDHKNYDFVELTTSCKSQFIDGDRINIHILHYVIYMISHYNICMPVHSDVLANCYITKNTCVIKLYHSNLALHRKQMAIIKNAKNIDDVKKQNTFRFYINDFTKCKYTVIC